jgi:hypothetical protein
MENHWHHRYCLTVILLDATEIIKEEARIVSLFDDCVVILFFKRGGAPQFSSSVLRKKRGDKKCKK